jgi:predicted RNase H-like nuclease
MGITAQEMRVVLGIDAAWTPSKPSGVALAAESSTGWRIVAIAESYAQFLTLADDGRVLVGPPTGSLPNASALLAAAAALSGASVDLVAIDMPLARSAINGRRVSDNKVSQAYGARKCGTHSPSALRPGRLSDDLRKGFERAGYPLQTETVTLPGIIEVYPHPALVELAVAKERLSYKAMKVRSYWPESDLLERRIRLYRQWSEIVALLEDQIAGVKLALPDLNMNASGREIKAFEDKLDAIVCAWVAVRVLLGKASSYGNQHSAIWIPNPVSVCSAYGASL